VCCVASIALCLRKNLELREAELPRPIRWIRYKCYRYDRWRKQPSNFIPMTTC
jgi:hypothetical protein